jgi:hypothetical protein
MRIDNNSTGRPKNDGFTLGIRSGNHMSTSRKKNVFLNFMLTSCHVGQFRSHAGYLHRLLLGLTGVLRQTIASRLSCKLVANYIRKDPNKLPLVVVLACCPLITMTSIPSLSNTRDACRGYPHMHSVIHLPGPPSRDEVLNSRHWLRFRTGPRFTETEKFSNQSSIGTANEGDFTELNVES